MNDKFKVLALQATIGKAEFENGSYYVATPDKMQKLCELIVRECSNFLKDTLDDHFAAEQLEEHFGVEE